MALFVTRNGTDWVQAFEGEGATGPCVGFDSILGRPVWRHPDGTVWVDATGNPVNGLSGQMRFDVPENSALYFFFA